MCSVHMHSTIDASQSCRHNWCHIDWERRRSPFISLSESLSASSGSIQFPFNAIREAALLHICCCDESMHFPTQIRSTTTSFSLRKSFFYFLLCLKKKLCSSNSKIHQKFESRTGRQTSTLISPSIHHNLAFRRLHD